MDAYRNFIALSRYARWREEDGRRESWSETVDRWVNFFDSQVDIKPQDLKDVREAILNHEVMPSMRGLMTAGPALERNHIALYNCAFTVLDSLRSFDEILYVLSHGTGVGFSVEKQFVDKLPEVAETFVASDTTITVGDSKEGWQKAFRELLALLWAGQLPNWDISKVRPRGTRLKTFGGTASGPGPLVELFEFATKLVHGAAGRKITPLEAHDLVCKIGDVIVSGGVRRSALISLSDLGDTEMAHAKAGAWWENNGQRALANNSAIYESKPSMDVFMTEWKALYDSKSGERGIVNRQAMRWQADKNERRDSSKIIGTNPCCVSGDTLIMTSTGPVPIRELRGTPFKAVVNGKEYDAPHGSWIAGYGDAYELRTKEGHTLTLTPEHQILTESGDWVEAQDLKPGDMIVLHDHSGQETTLVHPGREGIGYLLGMFVGDGNFSTGGTAGTTHGQVKVWKSEEGTEELKEYMENHASELPHRSDWNGWSSLETKAPYHLMSIGQLPQEYGIMPDNKHDIREIETETYSLKVGFLQGLFDADGHIEGWREGSQKGLSVRLGQSNYGLLQSVQRMLLSMGINSKIYDGHPARKAEMPDGKGGSAMFDCAATYRLVISAQNVFRFQELIGFRNTAKAERLDIAKSWRKKVYNKPFTATVESFEYVGELEVWDAEVSEVHAFDANGIYAHNSEIQLRPYQFCNLSEVVVRPEDTLEDLERKTRLAALIGTWQASFTNFKGIRKVWKNNTEEEALLGVSMTGVFGNTLTNGVDAGLEDRLEQLREVAVEVNRVEAERIGINQATAVTCVKPSGTVSQLTGVSSGLHTWHNEYYIRTVRGSNDDPITNFLKDVGIPAEPDVMNPDKTTVFSFPQAAPEGAITRKDLTAVEHLEMWLTYQRHWCEHKPSVTISVREDEWLEVGAWVYEHFDEMSGVSFLPYSEHTYQQAPYQDVDEATYKEALEAMPKEIRWEDLSFYEFEDGTTGSQELACSSGACEIVDIS